MLFFHLCTLLSLTCVDDFVSVQVPDAVEDPTAHIARMNIPAESFNAVVICIPSLKQKALKVVQWFTCALMDQAGGLGG